MTAAQERRKRLSASRAMLLERMIEIRRFEESLLDLFDKGLVHGTTHLYNGQEAVAVGVAHGTDFGDHVTATYRSHGIGLALGMTIESVVGEILGKTAGCVRGLGGSMHLVDRSVGLLPTFAIVGAGLPVAVGAALTEQMSDSGAVAVAVFGDGATNIGAFHESLNLAAIWKLPVIFVCENNLYGEYSPIATTTPVKDLATRAASYAIPSQIVDGQDVDAVSDEVRAAASRARDGQGPQFIEAKTYRYVGHSKNDKGLYRDPLEVDRWKEHDPIDVFAARLLGEGLVDESDIDQMEDSVLASIETAVASAMSSSDPDPEDLFRFIYA